MNINPASIIKLRTVDYLIILSCCVLLLCVVIQIGSHVVNPPELTIHENRLDFGVIPSGIPIKKIVNIKNSGGQKLIIQSVRTGCGCIELKIHNNILEAGQQSIIEVVLTGESRPVSRSLDMYVFSNDKRRPVQHVVVQYSSVNGQYFEPSQLDFGIIRRDRLPVTRSLKIIEPKNELAKKTINNIEVFPSAEFVESKAELEDNLTRSISVTLKDNAPIGEFYEHLEIADAANGFHYQINILGSVRGEVYAIPKVLDYGAISRNTSDIDDVISLYSRSDDPQISILSVNISESIKSFVFHGMDSEDKSKLNIRLSTRNYDAAWTTTEVSGTLIISCMDSQKQVFSINIPVRFHMKVERVLRK